MNGIQSDNLSNLTRKDLIRLYRNMVETRVFEEMVASLNIQKGIPETAHLCIGQEAIGVGACYALRKQDFVVPALRDRSVFLCRGVSPSTLMAGVLAKRTGPAKGKWPAHHMGDLEKGIMAASLVIGSQFPLAVGAGLAFSQKGTDQVCVCFFGDGASNRGDFHESLNLAAILQLPVIFLCENNRYAIDTPTSKSMLIDDIAVRAESYGFPGMVIDGNDVLAVYQAVDQAAIRARSGEGPTLLECKTYRMRPHTERLQEDRSEEELEYWSGKCPLKRFREFLYEQDFLNQTLEEKITNEVNKIIDEAVRFAEDSPYPGPEELFEDIYADSEFREGWLCMK
jgi:TPP-dependent pyruvate/acetoin dehydrogenase alpha subunit